VDERRLLRIYLADHLAVVKGSIAVAKRCLSRNKAEALGDYLGDRLLPDIEDDLRALNALIDRVGACRSAWKWGGAVLAVQLGRLKLNGRVVNYSPLSRVEELEGLRATRDATATLWRTIASLAERDPGLRGTGAEIHASRAARHRDELERFRVEAARAAFG
jgi:hypothetical protein